MQFEYFGRGAINNLPSALNNLKTQRILLITGRDSYIQSGAKKYIDALLKNIDIIQFNDFSTNPSFRDAIAGSKICTQKQCTAIVAIGGGSAIDIAKSINAFQAHQENELALAIGESVITNPLLPLIAIPTTAGTGSEATHFSVIYVDNVKYSIASQSLLPNVAIIDPTFTDDLPSYITACTGFDALSQAIESYWAIGSTPLSQQYAAEAIHVLNDNLVDSVKFGEKEQRDKVSYASNLAGKAINISKTTAPHALSYTITTLTGLPHGHAVALTLGSFFTIHEKAIQLLHSKDQKNIEDIMKKLYQLFQVSNAEEAKKKWYEMMHTCDLTTDFKKLKLTSEATINNIIVNINLERLTNHPITLSNDMMKQVFKDVI